MRQHHLVSALVVAALVLMSTARAPAQTSALSTALAAAASHLQQLGRDADGVVIAEDYAQQAQGQVVTARRLRSDLAILADPTAGWIEFRDTLSVDGKDVPDRQARVVDLFANASADAREQIRRVTREGARFNLSALGVRFDRTINLPMAALVFLRTENQSRSTFKFEDFENVAGARTVVVIFQEQAKPRVIASADDAAASGTFWIEPTSGIVRRSLLRLESHRGTTVVNASIRVDYADVPSLHLWLPKLMDESYMITSGAARQTIGAISGRAVYSNYRKFNVAVSEQAAPSADETK
jgi:hypothetical protein